jgi:hypothetical protein
MDTVTTRVIDNEKLEDIEQRLRQVGHHLREMKQRLDEEIRHYPTPIPRCDAQFNYLFELRARLHLVLERIDASKTHADSTKLLEEFVRSPAYLDEPAEAALRARLGSELPRVGH